MPRRNEGYGRGVGEGSVEKQVALDAIDALPGVIAYLSFASNHPTTALSSRYDCVHLAMAAAGDHDCGLWGDIRQYSCATQARGNAHLGPAISPTGQPQRKPGLPSSNLALWRRFVHLPNIGHGGVGVVPSVS